MVGSGSGNSKRVRDSLIKTKLSNNFDDRSIKNMITKKINHNKELNKNKKRSMSSHVNSRWFRAPEIALVEKQYDGASDVWSLGCVLYELMQMRNGTKKNYLNGYALFPSGHCFPLSPKKEN
jgi:serine/threonine protein kinase